MPFSGAALRSARKSRRISAAALGRDVGRSEWSIWGYEAGRTEPPLSVAQRLAERLDVGLGHLVAAREFRSTSTLTRVAVDDGIAPGRVS